MRKLRQPAAAAAAAHCGDGGGEKHCSAIEHWLHPELHAQSWSSPRLGGGQPPPTTGCPATFCSTRESVTTVRRSSSRWLQRAKARRWVPAGAKVARLLASVFLPPLLPSSGISSTICPSAPQSQPQAAVALGGSTHPERVGLRSSHASQPCGAPRPRQASAGVASLLSARPGQPPPPRPCAGWRWRPDASRPLCSGLPEPPWRLLGRLDCNRPTAYSTTIQMHALPRRLLARRAHMPLLL